MSRYFICTFGCRCNQADSAAIRESFRRISLHETQDPRKAELLVVNTCTVTRRADQQARQAVRKLHRENPGARVVVTGCYAERDPQALAAIGAVSMVVGNADKQRLAEIVQEGESDCPARIIRSPFDAGRSFLEVPGSQTVKTRPFVKIQDGCDARCSYCTIPAVRGPGRSALPEDIVKQIRILVRHGFQEIVLTGVHLGAYGRKLSHPTNLVDLIRRILDIPGLGRLRLSSIEPMRFAREIVRLAAANPVFSPHFHIPLQSGSDKILRLMRRPYKAELCLDLLNYIRDALPSAGLGSDVIVGFPGETDEDFEETCSLISRSPLTYLHVFPFSGREGTDAFAMPAPVPDAAIRKRASILREISRAKNLAFRRRFVGQVLTALTLAKEEQMGQSVVLTGNFIHARVAANHLPSNRLVRVRIDDARADSTTATLLGTDQNHNQIRSQAATIRRRIVEAVPN